MHYFAILAPVLLGLALAAPTPVAEGAVEIEKRVSELPRRELESR
jgi:hypothetical protein